MSVHDGPHAVGGCMGLVSMMVRMQSVVYGMSVQDGPHAVGGCMG